MAVSDFLEKIGEGLEGGVKAAGRVAGAVLPVVGKSIVNEEAGYAPQIAAEGRQHTQQMEDAQIQAKEQELTRQLDMGRKYGTLTPDQQSQYVEAITNLYSHPRHAGTLMEKLRQAVHPKGAVASPGQKLPDAGPAGGTAAADEANAEKLAAAKLAAKPKKDFDRYLDKYADAHGIGSVDQMSEAQYEDALHAYSGSKRAEKLKTGVVEDPDSETHFSAVTWDLSTGKLVSKFPGVLPPRGMIPTERVTSSTDQFGNHTESVSQMTPQIPGTPSVGRQPLPTHGEAPKPEAAKKSTPASVMGTSAPKKAASAPKKSTPAAAMSGARQLDPNGHIPEGVGISQVREYANELLDGKDEKDIPAKAKGPAAQLAREYGWSQGTFTPKEQVLLKESSTFLNEAANNPVLSVLDSPVSRIKLQQLIGDPSKKGLMGHIGTNLAAGSESPEEAEFVRMYNQLVGTISGLGQLTRSGRTTEATINRLINELPSPYTTTSAEDAKARLSRLQQELSVATQKGNFDGGGGASPKKSVLPKTGDSQVIVVSPEDLK